MIVAHEIYFTTKVKQITFIKTIQLLSFKTTGTEILGALTLIVGRHLRMCVLVVTVVKVLSNTVVVS